MSRPNLPNLSKWVLSPDQIVDGESTGVTYDFPMSAFNLEYIKGLMEANVSEAALEKAYANYIQFLQESWAKRCLQIDASNASIEERNLEIEEQNTAVGEGEQIPLIGYQTFPPKPQPGEMAAYFAIDSSYKHWRKMNAFEFNGVMCSVTEADQNGWTSIDRFLEKREAAGEAFVPVPFNNDNGKTVVLNTAAEWDSFYATAWAKRAEFFGVSA